MRFKNVTISAFAYQLPEHTLTTEAIESQLSGFFESIHFPKGRLEAITGIKERRVWPTQFSASQASVLAADKLLTQVDFPRNKVDLLVHTGVCRDYLEPATASIIHHHLGLDPHCMVFDLSNACVAFMNAMLVAGSMIESGTIRNALIVTGENSGPIYPSTITQLLDPSQSDTKEARFRDSLASLTLGSGAVAFLLQHSQEDSHGPRLMGGLVQADSSAYELCKGYGSFDGGLQMKTDTQGLMKAGLELSKISWELFKRELDWNNTTPDHVITHQISLAHQQKVFELLGLDLRKGYSDLTLLGNTGSAAAPMSLVMRAEEGMLKKSQSIAMLGIGSGLNTVMLGVRW